MRHSRKAFLKRPFRCRDIVSLFIIKALRIHWINPQITTLRHVSNITFSPETVLRISSEISPLFVGYMRHAVMAKVRAGLEGTMNWHTI